MLPSQAAETPAPVTATFTAVALASDVVVITPLLVTSSSPAPASIPVLFAIAVASDTAADTPLAETATLTEGTIATDDAVITLSFSIVSSPLTTDDDAELPSCTRFVVARMPASAS